MWSSNRTHAASICHIFFLLLYLFVSFIVYFFIIILQGVNRQTITNLLPGTSYKLKVIDFRCRRKESVQIQGPVKIEVQNKCFYTKKLYAPPHKNCWAPATQNFNFSFNFFPPLDFLVQNRKILQRLGHFLFLLFWFAFCFVCFSIFCFNFFSDSPILVR